MSKGILASIAVLAGVAAAVTVGCFQPRKEPHLQRINSLRLQYRVSASWYEMRTGKDGTRELVMSLDARNTGKLCLKQVTMMLKIVAPDGSTRISQPLTFDVSHIPPEGSGKLEPVVRGVEVYSGEDLVLQMEELPSRKARESYPEYKEGLS